MNTIEPVYLNVKEAMAYLRASREYLYRLINQGEIETIKRGVRRLIVFQSLKAYAERERAERSS